jgi:hypothetical protein
VEDQLVESGLHVRALVLCGVAVTAVAAPAAAQLPPVPTVQVPPVPTVQLPPVPTVVPTAVPTAVPTVVPTAVPTVTPPPLPSVPGVSGGGSGSTGGGGSSGSGSGSGAASGGSGSGSSGGSSGATSGGGSRTSSSGGSGASSDGGAASRGTSSGGGTRRAFSGARSSKPSPRTLAARRDRKLREAVLARRSCLGSLSRPERLVLTLRAGVDAAAPRTRRSVARRLRITIRRVTKLEHAGLRRLRAVCGASTTVGTTTDRAAPPAPGATLAQAPPDSSSKSGTPSRAATPAPSTEAEEPPSRGGVAGRSATNLPSPDEHGFALWIPLLFLVCGVAGYFASRLLPARAGGVAVASGATGEAASRHWGTPPAGGVESPPAPAPKAPLPAHKPPADDPPPKLPSHRAPVRHRH